jgi:hypothetical protein
MKWQNYTPTPYMRIRYVHGGLGYRIRALLSKRSGFYPKNGLGRQRLIDVSIESNGFVRMCFTMSDLPRLLLGAGIETNSLV